jgi:transcription elongation factor GreB
MRLFEVIAHYRCMARAEPTWRLKPVRRSCTLEDRPNESCVAIMNKAFVKESGDDDADDDLEITQPEVPAGARNYITPAGHKRLRDELLHLIDEERPEVVKLVSWAASNGDRSENGDYIYGKRRLREIDRRIRFLTKRLDLAKQENLDQVFFGATVDYATADGETHTVTIVGVDEVDLEHGHVSWISPIARALLKARIGDTVTLHTPAGAEQIDVLDVRYPSPGAAQG